MPAVPHEILTRNLRSLAAAGGEDLILPVESSEAQTEVLPSGSAEVHIRGLDDRWVRLTGKHPEAAAAALVSSRLTETSSEATVIVIGPALGHVVEAVFATHPQAHVITLEPDPAIARQMLARRSWQPWLDRRQLALLIGPEYRGASGAWSLIDGRETEPVVLINPVVEREWNDSVVAARRVVARIIFDARANAEARQRFEGRYVLQTLENLPVIARSPDVSCLFGRFSGVPVILVGAGPSLDAVLPSLEAARERALLIAVDTALRPLLEHGIAPDLTITVDPSLENARHLTKLPPAPTTWLVAEPSVHPSALEHFTGRTLIFRVGSHHPWPWLATTGTDCAVLRTWGSVITSGFDLARRMGCDPIVFVGADCAYTGEQPYCRGTAFESDWTEQVSDSHRLPDVWRSTLSERSLVYHSDIRGVETPTAPHLLAFRDWLVDETGELTQDRVINATGAGLLQGGRIQLADLGSVLSGRLKDAPECDRKSLRTLVSGHQAHVQTRLDAITEAMRRIREIADGPVESPLTEWLPIAGEASATLLEIIDRVSGTLACTTTDVSPSDGDGLPVPRRRIWPPEQRLVLDAVRHGLELPDIPISMPENAVRCDWLQVALERLVEDAAGGYQAITAREALAQAVLSDASLVDRRDAHVGPPAEQSVDLRQPWGQVAPGLSDDARDERQLTDMAVWMILAARTQARPSGAADGRTTRLIEAVAYGLGDTPRLPAQPIGRRSLDCGLTLTYQGRRTHARTTLAFDSLTRALTGAFRETSGQKRSQKGDLRLAERFQPWEAIGELSVRATGPSSPGVYDPSWPLDPSTAWISPRPFALPSLEACFYVTQLKDGRALLVSSPSGRTFEVGPGGDVVEQHGWPGPVTGVVPWGAEGGFVAWTGEIEPRLFVRDSARASVETFPFPAHAHTALATSDAVILPTINGGVWCWRRETGCTLLLETPPVSAARHRDGGFEFEPVVVTSGPAFPRVRLDYTWTWAPGDATARKVPVGPAGQCLAEVSHAGCTARVFPYSDLVRLSLANGRRFELHVAQPLMAAWIGSETLLVTTATGSVVAFDDLTTQHIDREDSV